MPTTNFSAGTVLASTWLNEVDSAVFEGTGAFVPTGTGAVTRSTNDKGREVVSPEDFGAVGDGTTNDLSKFLLMFAASNSVRLTSGKTYWLGDVTSDAAIFSMSGTNKIIDFNGAKIKVNTTGGNYNAPIFQLDNIDGFTLIAPDIEDTGFDINVDFKGVSVVRLHPATGEVRNIHMVRCKFKSLVAAIDCTSAANISENIWFDGECYNTLYGIALTSNGHNLWADYRSYNNVRSYFGVGVYGHNVRCVSTNHNARGNADFMLKVYQTSYPLKNNTFHFTTINSQSTTNPQMVFESQDTGTGVPLVIQDITVYYNDEASPLTPKSIAFRHYNSSGVLQASDPNVKQRLRISGYARGTIEYLSTPATVYEHDFSELLPKTNFLAYKSTDSLNVTGNGTVVDVVFDIEQQDFGNNYNPATGVFTATRRGWHTFSAQVLLSDKTSAMLRSDLAIITTPRTFTNTATVSASSDYPEQSISVNVSRVFLEIGDTAKVSVVVYSGAGNTADIQGDSVAYTFFSGGVV